MAKKVYVTVTGFGALGDSKTYPCYNVFWFPYFNQKQIFKFLFTFIMFDSVKF